jgi:pyruvate ferredoxin oxidoreductase alpha subunit
MDRCESYNGNCGPLGAEVTAGLYRNKIFIEALCYTYGLAGRDFTTTHVKAIFEELKALAAGEQEFLQNRYIGLRTRK